MNWFGSKDIKDLLDPILKKLPFSGSQVLDVPAGSGHTSRLLLDMGASVQSFDLFPEFFKESRISCAYADLQDQLPVKDQLFDWVIFQEGIEHLPDQLKALKEMNRVLKPGGKMILTTPNFSNLRSRFSYFLMESESPRVLPPNEIDSVWVSTGTDGKTIQNQTEKRLYYGHIFSVGIQRLRVLGKLAGFEIVQVHPSRVNWSSFFIYLLVAPWIWLKMTLIQRRSVRKLKLNQVPTAYQELFKLGNSMNVLCGGHLILEMKKVSSPDKAAEKLTSVIQNFEAST